MKIKMFVCPEDSDYFLSFGKTRAEQYSNSNGLFYFDSACNEYRLGKHCSRKRLEKILGNVI